MKNDWASEFARLTTDAKSAGAITRIADMLDRVYPDPATQAWLDLREHLGRLVEERTCMPGTRHDMDLVCNENTMTLKTLFGDIGFKKGENVDGFIDWFDRAIGYTWWQEDDAARTYWFVTPGATADDVSVEVVDQKLHIKGEWEAAGKQMSFSHHIVLQYPTGEGVTAGVEHGLAWVKIPNEVFHRKFTVMVE
jgi:HSP20 family molecular chaperone IbpA